MTKSRNKQVTLKKILYLVWITVFSVILILYVAVQTYILQRMTENVETNIKKNLSACEMSIEGSLATSESYIFESYYNDSSASISRLVYTYLFNPNEIEKINAEISLTRLVQGVASWSDVISFELLYIDDDKAPLWIDAGVADTYLARQQIKNLFQNYEFHDNLSKLSRYSYVDDGNKCFLLQIMKLDQCYFVIGVSEETLLYSLANSTEYEDSILFVADEDGKIIMSTDFIGDRIHVEHEGKYLEINEKEYLQTGYILEPSGYYFGVLTSGNSIRKETQGMRVFFVISFLTILILAIFVAWFLNRNIQKPLYGIVEAIKEVEAGELDVEVTEISSISEFHQLVQSFNHMVARIKKLKIEKYEAKLTAQKSNLQYLQMQIKPHFYANALNIIYSLAQTKDYETIQRLSKAIVNFSRYNFHDATELVELKREIEYVENYMEIQEIRYKKQVTLVKNIPEQFLTVLMPPFIIQSFVENSVKYAFHTKANCMIEISARLDEQAGCLIITVHDNGAGYPDEYIQNDWRTIKKEGHIGLHNVTERLFMIYEDKASVEIANDQGAVSYIRIPYISVDDYLDMDDF